MASCKYSTWQGASVDSLSSQSMVLARKCGDKKNEFHLGAVTTLGKWVVINHSPSTRPTGAKERAF